MPYAWRDCEVCTKTFQPRKAGQDRRCTECRNLELGGPAGGFSYSPGAPVPQVEVHHLAAPLKQAVFDLETFALDRAWGVLLVGCILVHGDGPEPKLHEFDLTMSSTWPEKRSNDSELAAAIISVLSECHVAYAHNGRNFDIPYLNSVALRYGMPSLKIKLIDPVQIARKRYRIGSNSLSSLAQFLQLEEEKMPLPPDVWKNAVLDADKDAWDLLRARCRSDVSLLNQVASKVTRDVGLIDYDGSGWR